MTNTNSRQRYSKSENATMHRQSLRYLVLFILLPVSLSSLIYLYLYPVWHGCGFPLPPPSPSQLQESTTIPTSGNIHQNPTERGTISTRLKQLTSKYPVVNTFFQHLEQRPWDWDEVADGDAAQLHSPAIFRLLVLADPQIEGDSSLPDPEDEFWPRVKRRWRYFFGGGVVNGEERDGNGNDTDMSDEKGLAEEEMEDNEEGEAVGTVEITTETTTATTTATLIPREGESEDTGDNFGEENIHRSSSDAVGLTTDDGEREPYMTENAEISNADPMEESQLNKTVANTSEVNATSEAESEEPKEGLLEPLLRYIRLPTPISMFLGLFFDDIPSALAAIRKRVDLFGNDFYLAHIYRTLHWWSRPTHVTVLGDLIGSQWVTDGEFEARGTRFWDRVFRGGQRLDDTLTVTGKRDKAPGEEAAVGVENLEVLQRYESPWENLIMNVAGNHDIGYAGDVSEARLERFERTFGRANWDIRFKHAVPEKYQGITPTIHIVNLNDLTLDTPALDESIQAFGYDFINGLITHRSYPVEDRTSFTLLLTHVPLHKKAGVCTDPPHFAFFDDYYEHHLKDNKTFSTNETENEYLRYLSGGLREQNHLSDHVSSTGILQGIFGMTGNPYSVYDGKGRAGLILTGHDHTGCDVVHFVNRTVEIEEDGGDSDSGEDSEAKPDKDKKEWFWDAIRLPRRETRSRFSETTVPSVPVEEPQLREITLRSMMGEYGGNAGLLSLWFDFETQTWDYEMMMCPLGVQHIWWAVHVLGLITSIATLAWIGVEACYSIVGIDAVEVLEGWISSKVKNMQHQNQKQNPEQSKHAKENGKVEKSQALRNKLPTQ